MLWKAAAVSPFIWKLDQLNFQTAWKDKQAFFLNFFLNIAYFKIFFGIFFGILIAGTLLNS